MHLYESTSATAVLAPSVAGPHASREGRAPHVLHRADHLVGRQPVRVRARFRVHRELAPVVHRERRLAHLLHEHAKRRVATDPFGQDLVHRVAHVFRQFRLLGEGPARRLALVVTVAQQRDRRLVAVARHL
eukprot:4540031-Prymnesium_polylepis.1